MASLRAKARIQVKLKKGGAKKSREVMNAGNIVDQRVAIMRKV